MFPLTTQAHAIIIEFKTLRSNNEKNLTATCNNALRQIHEKGYINSLLDKDVKSNNIYIYGFAFQGKKILITGGAYTAIDWDAL